MEVGRENAYDCQNKMNDQEELIRLVSDGSDRNNGEDGKSYPGQNPSLNCWYMYVDCTFKPEREDDYLNTKLSSDSTSVLTLYVSVDVDPFSRCSAGDGRRHTLPPAWSHIRTTSTRETIE